MLIPPEYVSGVYFFCHVIKAGVVAVGYDGLGEGFEAVKVVYYKTSEECAAVFQGGFVDDYGGPFGLDAFHYPLY